MPFGSQVEETSSLGLLDRAYDGGINFVDTAEMYASPPTADSYGKSEEIVGRWLQTKPRESVVLATKIAGPNDGMLGAVAPHIRAGSTAHDYRNFVLAVEGSLKRLRCDYIDLYLTHWPDRRVPMEAQLEAFDRLIEAGKIRYAGVSNETPWGLTRLVATAEAAGLRGPVCVQNLYNLLERDFETGLAEVCLEEEVAMVAYSPLAMGVLSGKYSGGGRPAGARLTVFERYRKRYGVERVLARADRYVALARQAELEPAAMAIAWARDRPGVASVVSSCTRPEQVDALLAAAELRLPADLRDAL
jgi:aryl-alcohol dehydrogenase-like predicted oxidoreductase